MNTRIPERTSCPREKDLIDFAQGALDRVAAARVGQHLAGCSDCGRVIDALQPTVRPTSTEALVEPPLEEVPATRYRLVRELARGGMGCIYEAWDARHGRAVAIKMMLGSDPGLEARFTREALVTSRLQHPAIVALYEAGRWTAGEPFFAMKLVLGRALGDVIVETRTLEGRLALLPRLVAVTEALAYAHGQKIVHRDLKPANVLIGAFGETVVIDWGLAKVLTAADDAPATNGSEADAQDGMLTAIGQAIGTPCYMPPEQARGEAIDARADVYALGAMLYQVVSGASPHGGTTPRDTIRAVLDGPPAPLASRVPKAPRDLVTLIEKAMARDPDDRYPTAKALAEDLQRFTTGQLVHAHPYSAAALARRWVSRHQGITAMALLLVFALSLVGTFSVRRVLRERDRADAAKAVAEGERHVALAQRDASEALVDYILNTLRGRLDTLNRLDLLQGVGAEVDKYYGVASPTGSLDAARLRRRGLALAQLASVEDMKNDEVAARALYTSSNELNERAIALAPHDREAWQGLAEGLMQLAGLDMDDGKLDDAERRARAAVEAAKHVKDDWPEDAKGLKEAARAGLRLALVLRRNGGAEPLSLYDEAERMLRRAVELPATAQVAGQTRSVLGWAYYEHGDMLIERGDLDGAAVTLAECVRVRTEMASSAKVPRWDYELGQAKRLLAHVAGARGNWREEKRVASDALVTERALWQAEPDDLTEWGHEVASNLVQIAQAEQSLEDEEGAFAHAREALGIFERMAAMSPNAQTDADIAGTLLEIAEVELARGRAPEAVSLLQRAAKLEEHGDFTAFRQAGANIGPELVRAELAAGDEASARADAEQALIAARRWEKEMPSGVVQARAAMARVKEASGDATGAASSWGEVLAGYDAAAKAGHEATEVIGAAEWAERLAVARTRAHDAQGAREAWEREVTLLESIERVSPLGPGKAARLKRAREAVAAGGR